MSRGIRNRNSLPAGAWLVGAGTTAPVHNAGERGASKSSTCRGDPPPRFATERGIRSGSTDAPWRGRTDFLTQAQTELQAGFPVGIHRRFDNADTFRNYAAASSLKYVPPPITISTALNKQGKSFFAQRPFIPAARASTSNSLDGSVVIIKMRALGCRWVK